jgi:hypothetical protein
LFIVTHSITLDTRASTASTIHSTTAIDSCNLAEVSLLHQRQHNHLHHRDLVVDVDCGLVSADAATSYNQAEASLISVQRTPPESHNSSNDNISNLQRRQQHHQQQPATLLPPPPESHSSSNISNKQHQQHLLPSAPPVQRTDSFNEHQQRRKQLPTPQLLLLPLLRVSVLSCGVDDNSSCNLHHAHDKPSFSHTHTHTHTHTHNNSCNLHCYRQRHLYGGRTATTNTNNDESSNLHHNCC